MKYIDAEKLIAKIEKALKASELHRGEAAADGSRQTLYWIKDLIASLQEEQPKVDLEKELEKWRHDHFKGKRNGDYNGEYLERESQLDLAHHFYDLGLNARKEKCYQ